MQCRGPCVNSFVCQESDLRTLENTPCVPRLLWQVNDVYNVVYFVWTSVFNYVASSGFKLEGRAAPRDCSVGRVVRVNYYSLPSTKHALLGMCAKITIHINSLFIYHMHSALKSRPRAVDTHSRTVLSYSAMNLVQRVSMCIMGSAREVGES